MSTVADLKNQGNQALQAGDYDSAITSYTQAIEMEPQNHILYSNRANIYYQARKFDLSLEDANKVIELNPNFSKGYIRKCDALMALGKHDDAFQALRDGEQLLPEDELLKQRQEEMTSQMQNQMQVQIFGRSENELRSKMIMNPRINQMMLADPTLFGRVNAMRLAPNFLEAAQGDKDVMGVVLELMGIGQMAAEEPEEQAAESNSEYEAPQEARIPEEHTEQEAKKEEPKPELNEDQKRADEYKNEGNEEFKNQRYDEAIALYEKAFDTHKSITYLNNIATALLKQGKYQESADKAQEAYDYGNENAGSCTFQEKAKSLMKKGSALYEMKKYEEAIDVLKQSMLEVRDKTTLALLNKVEDEYTEFKKQQAYSPEEAEKLKAEGNELVKGNKFIEAVEVYGKALKHLPVDMMDENAKKIYVGICNNRSLALFKAAQFNDSYEDCQTVLKYDPKNIKALLRKAQIERLRRQYYLSVETYEDVLQIDERNAEAIEGYGKTYEKIQEMQSGKLSEKEMQEITQIAMSDDSMQKLATDPGMSEMIQSIQSNPAQAEEFLSDPVIGKKLQRLINAGVLKVGGPRQ